jgi:NADH:ubiquinone oxidoreductase subunit 3 (subunit A)
MNPSLLLSPPVAFALLFAAVTGLSALSKRISFRNKNKNSAGSGAEYACGEDFKGHMAQPDYSQFFPFAFFFTILHVVALVIATVPSVNAGTFAIAAVYCAGAVIGLSVLQRS